MEREGWHSRDKSHYTVRNLAALRDALPNRNSNTVRVEAPGLAPATFQNTGQLTIVPRKVTPMGMLHKRQKRGVVTVRAVVARDSPECNEVVANALVAYAFYVKKWTTTLEEAFLVEGRKRFLCTLLYNNFDGAPLKCWLGDDLFERALAAAFSNPAKAKERAEEHKRRVDQYRESPSVNSTASGVSHGPVGCLDLFWIRVAPSHIVRY